MSDYIIRGTAAGDQVRFFAATTRELVETAREIHNTSPVATAALGRLLTAGAMMGSMSKSEEDLTTLQIKCNGRRCQCKRLCRESKCYPARQQQRETGCCRCPGSWCIKRHQGYRLKGALCRTDTAGFRRDCRGSNLLFRHQRAGTHLGCPGCVNES